jgi:hypothetical protein
MKRINITLPDEIHELGKKMSKELLGKDNLSGLLAYLLQKGDITLSEYLKSTEECKKKHCDKCIEKTVVSDVMNSGKVYKLGKELPKEFKEGLYRTTTDFVVGDEVYMSKV